MGEGLEFRITADRDHSMEDKPIIKLARNLPPDQNNVELSRQMEGCQVGALFREEFGGPVEWKNTADSSSSGSRESVPQALVLIDHWNITAEYVRIGLQMRGRAWKVAAAVGIRFNHQGAGRLES